MFKKNSHKNDIYQIIENLIDTKSNISRVKYAKEFFALVNHMDDKEFDDLMVNLRDQRDLDTDQLKICIDDYIKENSETNYIKLQKAQASKRKDLFRKLNCFDEGNHILSKFKTKDSNQIVK